MVIGRLRRENGNVVLVVGLSKGNIERLVDGQPILRSCGPAGLEGLEVSVMYGETEDAIVDALRRSGLVIHDDVIHDLRDQ